MPRYPRSWRPQARSFLHRRRCWIIWLGSFSCMKNGRQYKEDGLFQPCRACKYELTRRNIVANRQPHWLLFFYHRIADSCCHIVWHILRIGLHTIERWNFLQDSLFYLLYYIDYVLFVLMQSQLGKACTIKNSVFIRLLAYVVLMRLQQNKKPEQRMTTLSGKPVTQMS